MSLLLALTGAPAGLNAVRFDAAADTLTMPSAALPSGSGAWTVATWVRLVNDLNAVTTIWSLDGIFSSSWHSLQCDSTGTSLRLYQTGSTITTIANLTVGTWYFVVVRKSAGGTIKTYYGTEAGGALTTNSGTVTNITYAGDGYVGGNAYSEYLDGRMWGMRVWDAELSDAEVDAEFVASSAARTSNLRAQWLLDNATTPGTDSSGNSRDLTNAGGAWTLEAGPVLPAGSGAITGTLARTLGDATSTASGLLEYSGTLARTLGNATLAATGLLEYSGSLARTLGDATLAGTGVLAYSGTLARTLGDATSTASGLLEYSGTLARTLGDATLAATGTLEYSGSLARTLGDATLSAAGTLIYSGSVASTLGDATLAATGTVVGVGFSGDVIATLGDATLSAAGTLIYSGSLARTLGDATLAASGALTFSGSVASTLGDATSTASGILSYSGTLARTLGDATSTATGVLAYSGSVASTLANATLAGTGSIEIRGPVAATLGDATLSAAGSLIYSGSVAQTLGNATAAGSGILSYSGTLARTLGDATLAASGNLPLVGTVDVTLGNATLAGAGAFGLSGTVNVTLGGILSFGWARTEAGNPPRLPRQAFIQPLEVCPDLNETIVLGIHQSDVVIRSALIAAMADMRARPQYLDSTFASLVQDDLTKKEKGLRELQSAREWFLKTHIPVITAPVMDELKMPCITIELQDSVEVTNEATTGDTHYEPFEYYDGCDPALTTPFSPKSYNPVTGEVALYEDTLPADVYLGPGMAIVDRFGVSHTILRMAAKYRFFIAPVSTDFTGAVIKGVRPSAITSIESSSFRETYRIGVHVGGEPAHLVWLHSIVVFALLRYKEVLLEGRGFERSTFASTDLTRDGRFETENVFSRYINVSGHVRQYWPKVTARTIDVVAMEALRISGENASVRVADAGVDPDEALWIGDLDVITAARGR